jgi:ligand-binding SRPBCC domain-containing protein
MTSLSRHRWRASPLDPFWSAGNNASGTLHKLFQNVYDHLKRDLFTTRYAALSPERSAKERENENMPIIRLETFIDASLERCFDLSLSIDLHRHSVAHTHERPIAGVTSGVMKLGDTVTWEAVHFGIKQHLTSKITAYERPYRFTDEMIQGAFQEMTHLHEFVPQPPGTLMIDLFTFRAPLGILGRLAEMLILTRYMKGLLLTRNKSLKQGAEAGTDPALL